MQALFQPFRALGYISDDVPFAVQRRGKETFVTVSVEKLGRYAHLLVQTKPPAFPRIEQSGLNSAGVLLLQARREACGTPGMRLGQSS